MVHHGKIGIIAMRPYTVADISLYAFPLAKIFFERIGVCTWGAGLLAIRSTTPGRT